jgi:hypothetical protein
MGEVEVEKSLCGDGKLYRNINLKLKSEKEEEKILILEIQKNKKIFKKVSTIWLELVITATAGNSVKLIKALENGNFLIKTKNKNQAKSLVTLVNIGGLYEVRVTEAKERENNYEKGKLRDSGSRQKMATAISMMSEEEISATRGSKNTRKFHEKFVSSLLNARQRRGKVGTYFLTFVKAEPPDDERGKPVVTAMAPNKLLPSLERRRQAKTANGRPHGRLSR